MSFKNIFLIALVCSGFFLLYQVFNHQNNSSQRPFSELLNDIEEGRVKEALIKGDKIKYALGNNEHYVSNIPIQYKGITQLLYEKRIRFRIEAADKGSLLIAILYSWLPFILIVGVWFFIMKQLQGGNKMMGFGKSKAKVIHENENKITFANVAGIEEAKEEVDEVVAFLKDPTKFQKLGGKIPKGLLLIGKPGTGKTLLAKAIAGEAEASFFSISGSDFVEMFVGVGASRVRDLFSQAREKAPSIIFIDEIDAVGRHRGAGLGGGNDEREQTLNQLLVEMDGFNTNSGIIIIAATNRPDVLDPALLRPGRFDRQVIVPAPDVEGRKKILEIHTKPIKVAKDVDLKVIAKGTPGFTGADLSNLANEAALIAGRANKETVNMNDFEEAKEKILLGRERKSLNMVQKEKETTAYHEAGHAIIAVLRKNVDPLHKVTIIPRANALGITWTLPDKESYSVNRTKLIEQLDMMMGGRAAEELIYNHFTTGASNDLEKATNIAHQMVCNWAMSEKIGPVYLADHEGEVFLGRDMMRKRQISQKSSNEVDQEINEIVNSAYRRAFDLLKKHIDALHKVAKKLLEEETIHGSVVYQIVEENPAT